MCQYDETLFCNGLANIFMTNYECSPLNPSPPPSSITVYSIMTFLQLCTTPLRAKTAGETHIFEPWTISSAVCGKELRHGVTEAEPPPLNIIHQPAAHYLRSNHISTWTTTSLCVHYLCLGYIVHIILLTCPNNTHIWNHNISSLLLCVITQGKVQTHSLIL